MATVTSKVFRSGNSAALRLPREVAFDSDTEVVIVRSGDILTVYPARPSIQAMLDELAGLPKLADVEIRDVETIPERPGL
jgi:antitoxin VapB